MDEILKKQRIIKDESNKEQNSQTIVSGKIPVGISQIEKDLSNSLKLLESGLLNLDIEAAHFLNPGGLKNSFSLKEECSSSKSTSKFGEKRTVQFFHKATTILPPKQTNNVYHSSKSTTELKTKNTSTPPDLTFSFYSSEETNIPLTSRKRQIQTLCPVKSFGESSCSHDNDHSTLDEILSNSAKSDFSKTNTFESEMKNTAEINLVNELDAQEKTTDQLLNTKTKTIDIVLELNDLVKSLMNIQSALNDLDKEAAHILNPEYEVSYQKLSSLEDKTFFKNT